jgi:hypothetical protein
MSRAILPAQRLSLEAALPEAARHLVIPVASPGNRFGQTPHQPRKIRQTATTLLQARRVVADCIEFLFGWFGRSTLFIASLRKLPPLPHGHFIVRPGHHQNGIQSNGLLSHVSDISVILL